MMIIKIDKVDDISIRSIRLLNVDYRPSELAAKVGTNKRHILKLCVKGLPHRKEPGGKGANGRTLINGKDFMKWLAGVKKDMKIRKEIRSITRSMVFRAVRLLDMEYKPSELAEEIGASRKQVMRFIELGCTVRTDSKGHHWIHGLTFVSWFFDYAPKNKNERTIYKDNECYCVTCKARVVFTETKRVGKVAHGKCQYGHKVARFYSSTPKPAKKGKGKNQ